MAADSKSVFDKDIGSRVSIYKFRPEEILVNADLNGRHALPPIEWLIKDIVAHGQLDPVVVRKEGDRPALVAGFSRWRAIREINKQKLTPQPLPILATYFRGNERDGFALNIRENRFRNSTTPLDDAANITRLLAYQMDHESIARLYFPDCDGDQAKSKKAVAWVKKTAKLATLTPEAEQAMKEGRIQPSAAAHIAEMASEAQNELVEKKGKITASDVRRAEGKPAKMTLAEARKAIIELTEKDLTNDQLIAKLEALAERMK